MYIKHSNSGWMKLLPNVARGSGDEQLFVAGEHTKVFKNPICTGSFFSKRIPGCQRGSRGGFGNYRRPHKSLTYHNSLIHSQSFSTGGDTAEMEASSTGEYSLC